MAIKHVAAMILGIGLATALGCESTQDYVEEHETAQGALVGAGVGAVGGAVIGEMTTGDAAKGALIGGAVGTAAGAGVGYAVEKNEEE